ncbi:MAG: helix-turn-helix domain-containing protein [Frankiaceae bacterium]
MSIGEALASARRERGMTVDEVSQATRIRGTLIRAIETDDFGPCGGAVYARGHIRSIARAVGIDPVPLIEQFDTDNGTGPQLVTDGIFEAESKARPERTGPRWGAAMVAAVLVGVCALALASILGLLDGNRSQPTAQSRGPAASSSASAPSSSPSAHKPPRTPRPTPSDGAVAGVPKDGVNVRVRIIGAHSWLSVRNSAGATLLQKTLDRGQVFDAHDKKWLHFVIGDAGAVDLIVNDKEIGPPGGKGAVVNLTFRPGDPATSSQG